MADYGLDPAIVSYLQGGPQQIGTTEYPPLVNLPPPVPPPPPPTQKVGAAEYAPPVIVPPPVPPPPPQKIGPSQGEEVPNYGLPAPVLAGVQSGFTAPPTVSAPDLAVARQPLPEKNLGTVNLPTTDKEVAQANAASDKQKAAQAAFEASPEGLAQKSDAEQRAALDKERQANADALAAQVQENDAQAKALANHQQRQAEQDKIDQQKQAEDAANVQKYTQQYAQQVKDAADYKVDTNRDVGVRGMIAIALSGIGDALDRRHGPNMAAQIIESQIDKRVQDQWNQKKALGDKANESKGVLDQFRRNADDDRQAQQLHTAAELQKTSDEIKQIGAQYANPEAKARTLALSAQLDQKAAAITEGEAQRKAAALRAAQEERDRQAQLGLERGKLGLGYAQLAETKRENDLKFEENKQNNLARIAAKNAAAADKLKTEGVFDPSTGKVLLDPEGQKMEASAKALEQQAASAQNPDLSARLQKQADDIRAQAQIDHGVTVKDEKGELKDTLAGAQRLVNATQRIREALDDGSITDRSTRAKLKTEADNAFTAWAELNKVKASSREYQVYKEALGELDGITATNINKAPLKASLDALDTGTRNTTTALLHSRGIETNWTPAAPSGISAPVLSGKTSVERGADAQPSTFAKVFGIEPAHPFTPPEERNPLAVENRGPVTPTGLTAEDDAKVMNLINQYGKTSPDDNRRIVSTLSSLVTSPQIYDKAPEVNPGTVKGLEFLNPILGNAATAIENSGPTTIVPTDERKEAIANAVLGRIRGENPKLYKEVIATLPQINQDAIKKTEVP